MENPDQQVIAQRCIEEIEYQRVRMNQLVDPKECREINPRERPDAQEPNENWYRRHRETCAKTEFFHLEALPGRFERNKYSHQNYESLIIQSTLNLKRWNEDRPLENLEMAIILHFRGGKFDNL